ncbi:MAG: DUF2808 domain-containing protein [Anaerolineae bacterium]|nr:DUF2808 domain-containing protein [Gloeobacterales cyanobacterium ES-bin-313]
MKHFWLASLFFIASVQSAEATEIFFSKVPELKRSATDNFSSAYNYARYTFEVTVPVESGASLGGLVIGIPFGIRLPSPDYIQAVSGDGKPVALKTIQVTSGAVRLGFAEAIAPGGQVNIEFYPMRNPRTGGTFLFEVTALPAGETVHPQFLSYGRITFYSPGGRR